MAFIVAHEGTIVFEGSMAPRTVYAPDPIRLCTGAPFCAFDVLVNGITHTRIWCVWIAFLFFNYRLAVVVRMTVVFFICTKYGRGRGGPRLRSCPRTLYTSYIRFTAFDLSHLIWLNDALCY